LSAEEPLVIDGPYDNVWDAIEDDPVERGRLAILSDLMDQLEDHIKRQGWTQKDAAKHLGVTQPRISDLMRGKMSVFSIDAVIGLLTAAGLRVEVRVKKAA
jgi:predicted XRE-type DNA-binding protein